MTAAATGDGKPPSGRVDAWRVPELERARGLMARHLADERRVKHQVFRRTIFAASALCGVKLAAFSITGSLAILASALDSLLDLVVSVTNAVSSARADRPPDPEHPYGHGKIESLVGAIESVVLVGVAVALTVGSIQRLQEPVPVEATGWGIAAMVLSAGVALYLAAAIRRRARGSESPILAAEQLHYSVDFTSNAGVVLALVLQRWTGILHFDPFVSLLIAAFVLWQVRVIAMEAVRDLVDRALPDEIQSRIVGVLDEHGDAVIAYHGLRTRRAGTHRIVNLHLVLYKAITFETSHRIVDDIEQRLHVAVPHADVTIHADPCGPYCPGEDVCPRYRSAPGPGD